jgi:hypothetical protein
MLQAPANTPAPQAAKPAPPKPPAVFQEAGIAAMESPALIALLQDTAASEFQKAKACVRLGELGSKDAVPALAALLTNPHLSTYARYGLEPIADPSASDALRAALPKLQGNLLIGATTSLGKRRDAQSIPILAKMMQGADADLARAAASALGHIGGSAAAKELQSALTKAPAPTRPAIADATLLCAETLTAEGKRAEALSLYATLTTAQTPKPMRLAAMNAIIREETAVTRPK